MHSSASSKRACREAVDAPYLMQLVGEPSTALAPQLETARRAVLLLNLIGARTTRVIHDAGLSAVSSNVSIAVLTHLVGHGSARPRDLLGPTKLTRGGLSNLLSRLEAAGLITRTYGDVAGDRRSAEIAITQAGRDTTSAIQDILATTLDSLSTQLDELAALIDLIAPEDTPMGAPATATSNLDLLSRVGVVLTQAVAEPSVDDPAPSRSFVVLACAAQSDGTQHSALMKVTGLSSGGVSLLLDRLERADLIRRRTGLQPDRRVVTVELTTQGRDQLTRQLTEVAELLARLHTTIH